MKKILCILLVCVAAAVTVSCSCERTPLPMTIERTVLVYMASNNNLSSYSASDLEEMRSGFVPEWFDEGTGDVLLVYRHAVNDNPHLMRLSRVDGEVVTDTLISYPRQNSCKDTTFRKVLKDAFGQFQSEEKGLIISSHGTGWLPGGYYDHPVDYASADTGCALAPGADGRPGQALMHLPVTEDPYAWMVKSVGHEYDDDGTEMEIDVLKNSLIYHLDWLVFDCCLMGGVEVAYEMKDRCDYMVSSQTEILVDGFPYYGLMEIAFRQGSDVMSRVMDMADLYWRHYEAKDNPTHRSATVSVVKTSELPALISSVKDILAAGGSANTDTLSLDGYDELRFVQPYFRMNRHWFYDLDDYISRICPGPGLYSSFSAAMDKAVIYKAATESFLAGSGGFDITHFSGLSTYVPRPKNSYLKDYYSKLDWGAAICAVE